jgi:glycosyltransferase involved in cell wall biosynthesis
MSKVLIFASHPIQYQAPLFRLLAKKVDLIVIYGYNPKPKNQSDAGFGVAFEWDIPLLDGYNYEFATLKNDTNANTQNRNGLVLKNPNQIIEKHHPSIIIVHGWFPRAMVQMIVAAHKKKIPVWVRGDSNLQMKESKLKSNLKNIYFKWLFSKITGFLYVGKLNKALYQYYGVNKKRLVFAPHSVDTNRFLKEFDESTKVNGNQFVIGFVGKFIPIKNPLELIEAVNLSKYKSNIQIKWIGDGPMMFEIEQLCLKYKLSYSITGFLNQGEIVSKGYSDLDLMVLPSYNETWGLVVNEVYCGNIPVIVSDKVGCANDLVRPLNEMLVYDSGNLNSLKRSIDFAIKNIDTLKMQIPNISKSYSIDKTLNGYLKSINSNLNYDCK